MTDSWFSGLVLFLHTKTFGVDMAGTINQNRKGMDYSNKKLKKKSTIFADLKKKLMKSRFHWEPRSAPNHDLVVSAVKDSKVFLEATNSIGSHEFGSHEFDFFTR